MEPQSGDMSRTGHPASEIPTTGVALVPSPLPLATIDPPQPSRWRRRLVWIALAVLLGAGAAGGGFLWWQYHRAGQLPAGIASGNGRIEAEQVDIATKTVGRIAEVLVDEGAMVHAGQVLARMDAQEAEAALRRAQAQVEQARQMLEVSEAFVAQQSSQLQLAEAELGRTRALLRNGFATRQMLDQRSSTRDVALAALATARAQVAAADKALDAASEEARRLQAQLADLVLVAPLDGRVQYRLANPGEVLAAGGRVLTLLDITNVYMAVFLPTAEAGRAATGTEARIVLDAYPRFPIPAYVSFLSPQAQFTPKTVETRTERERLMFRVKLRINPDLLRAHAEEVRTGLPGTGYIRLDRTVDWPPWLQAATP